LFASPESDQAVMEMYDAFVEWKNGDYLPYLRRCGAMTPNLATHAATMPTSPEHDLHASLVIALRRRLKDHLTPRPAYYAFHDFRMCFIDRWSHLRQDAIGQLLWLSDSPPTDSTDKARTIRHGKIEIATTGWATVIRGGADTMDSELLTCQSLLSLVHAQWYFCQVWLNVLGSDFADGRRMLKIDPHEVSGHELTLASDLSEIANLDLMLKDPNLLRLARAFEGSFGVTKHRDVAHRRLVALENHSRQLADFTRERDLSRLQVLFSLSAAGSIAALIPALAQVGFPVVLSLLTGGLLFALWLGFALNYPVVLRRVRAPGSAAARHGVLRGFLLKRKRETD
jgi:hypothetical protein